MKREETEATPHPYRWWMLGGVWLIYFCFGLTTMSMAPLVVPIVADLDMSYAEMGMVLGGWQLVYIATAAPCGAVVDRWGRGWGYYSPRYSWRPAVFCGRRHPISGRCSPPSWCSGLAARWFPLVRLS